MATTYLRAESAHANPCLVEIDNLLRCYQRALEALARPDSPEMAAVTRIALNAYRHQLAQRGVTVCGEIGHA